jgi:hypothetical protein
MKPNKTAQPSSTVVAAKRQAEIIKTAKSIMSNKTPGVVYIATFKDVPGGVQSDGLCLQYKVNRGMLNQALPSAFRLSPEDLAQMAIAQLHQLAK